jgi:hypothetical protein
MKETLNIDTGLLQQARTACGAATDTETIRLGLIEMVRRDPNERPRALLGTEPDAQDVPRRRSSHIATPSPLSKSGTSIAREPDGSISTSS